ncbi:MAG: papain fold toxin domain-containing protein [Chroococcales cyanobacterium]
MQSDNGGQNNRYLFEAIRAIAEQYDIGTCGQCATAIKTYLKIQNIPYKHLRVETFSPQGLQGVIYDDGKNIQIATNGFHEGILLEIAGIDMVFDNLYPEGKPWGPWFQDLVVIPGNRLTVIIKEQLE